MAWPGQLHRSVTRLLITSNPQLSGWKNGVYIFFHWKDNAVCLTSGNRLLWKSMHCGLKVLVLCSQLFWALPVLFSHLQSLGRSPRQFISSYLWVRIIRRCMMVLFVLCWLDDFHTRVTNSLGFIFLICNTGKRKKNSQRLSKGSQWRTSKEL